MLSDGAAWLHAKRHQKLVEAVQYQRGTNSPVALSATRCRTAGDQMADDQVVIAGQTIDWIFRAEDFEGAGGPFPQARDKITGADGSIWEVAEISGEDCWRYSDEYQNAIRVHTVLA
jgi:hypothetical protein